MSKAPSMPMFWDAYLADTTHLTTEEHGAYMLLLAAMWRRNGWVPDDDRDNARILGMTVAKWKRTKARLGVFLTIEDDCITQKNLLKIWKNTQEKIAVNKQNGAKGGRAAARNNNDLAKANATVSLKRKATIPEPEPEPYKKEDTNVSLLVPIPKEPDRFDEFWEMYPRNVGRAAAKKKYDAALKKHRHDDIMFGLSQHLPDLSTRETQFIPHAATWLHGERFNDEPEPHNNLAGSRDTGTDATTRAISNAGRARRTPSKDCF